jgi:hypothetical protein
MDHRRAYAILLVLAVVFFAASFAISRVFRPEPGSEPAAPPPVIEAPALVEFGPPTKLPALRPPPGPPLEQ